jgi:Rieske Fe-S protein
VNNTVALHMAMGAYRTYAVALQAPADLPDGLYWDTADPYHYVRFHDAPGGRQMIIGGEDHRTGQAGDEASRFDLIEAWARSLWPTLGKRVGFWSGQIIEPADSLAFIGRNPGDEANVYVATGDSGQGMTHGTIAGMLLSDMILGRHNPWASLYDPNRTSLRAPGSLVSEAATSASGFADWVTGGDISDPAEVKPGSGAIMRLGLTKVAVSRSGDGKLCQRSAVCPHMGGLVRWNAAEGTWDCPVHGSRFSATGEVLNGPACEPLGPAESS